MFRRYEENRVSRLDSLPKLRPCHRWILITILIVDGQVPDIDDAELQSRRRKLGTFRLMESFRRLPTITATLRVLSMKFPSFFLLKRFTYVHHPICTASMEIDPPSTPSTGKQMRSPCCPEAST